MSRSLAFFVCLLLVCPRVLAGPDSAARAGVEKTLAAMSAAALAGDRDGFMACLDQGNAFFKQEQTAWCDDVVKHHPKAVAFSLSDDPAPVFGEDEARGTVSIAYTSAVGAATGGASGKWPGLFVHKDGKWLYAGEDWKKMEGEGFVVLYLPGSEKAAEMVLKAFPAARAHDDEGFGVKPGPQQIKLFQSMDHLKATVYLNQPDPALYGWNEHGESIKFMEHYAPDVPRWTAAFAHEYGHVCTWEYGAKIKQSPWWVQEGVAELAAQDFIPGSWERLDKEIRGRAAAGKTVPWEDISDYDKAAQPVKIMAYHQGHHMMGYVSLRWGRAGRQDWLKAMGKGESLDEATRDVLGMSFEELDKQWRESLTKPEGAEGEAAEKAAGHEGESDKVRAVREELELVGTAMSAAAVSGDTQAYLSHVYRGDSEFLNEQTYFAKDLKRKPAAECRIDLGDLAVGDGTAEGDVTWVWTMRPEVDGDGKSHEKHERSVTFRAKWISEGGAWEYAGETWERHTAPGVVVMCDPGLDELAKRTVQAFTDIRGRVEEGFGLEDAALPKKTQKIKLYGSMKHLQQSICLSYEDGLGGWNEPRESIKLLASENSSIGSLRHLLSHEYGHVATFELGPKANDAPWWVLEGVADLSAEKYGGTGKATVERWAKAGQLAKWDDLADFHTVTARNQRYVYVQGHHMLGYISERWGRDGRNKWLRVMAQGKTIDEATREALGMSFDALDREWRASLPAAEPAKKEEEAPAK